MVALRRKTRGRRNKKHTGSRRRRQQRGGARFVANVNPRVFTDEYQKAMDLIRQMQEVEAGKPRFDKYKQLLKYFLNSEEVIKSVSLRGSMRAKIDEFYALGKDYIDNDAEYAQLVQDVIYRINDLDARGVRHEVAN